MSRLPSPSAVSVLRKLVHGGILEAFVIGMEEADCELTTGPPDDDNGLWIELYDAGREIARAALGME